MVDLDSNPTKLIEVVEIGKQLLMTRGALTTFSIALARLKQPIDFGAIDGQPVDMILLLLPMAANADPFGALASVARRLHAQIPDAP